MLRKVFVLFRISNKNQIYLNNIKMMIVTQDLIMYSTDTLNISISFEFFSFSLILNSQAFSKAIVQGQNLL